MDQAIDSAKVWDKAAVQALITKSDKALSKALWQIFQRQTADEQSSLTTRHANSRGFNANDAEFLSDVAKRLPRYSFNMTTRQIARVRPMMKKYWRQLLEEIEANGGTVDYRIAKSSKGDTAIERQGDKAIERESESADTLESEIAGALSSDLAISTPPDQPGLWGAF